MHRPRRTDDPRPSHNIDPLVTIILKSSDPRDDDTQPQPIITPPIQASVLIDISGYFRSLYNDGAALEDILSCGQAHTIGIRSSLSWAYDVIFQAIFETGGRNLAQHIGIDRMPYSTVAILQPAVERLQMPELESRLLHRLETMTPHSAELAYLRSSFPISDISVQIFTKNLARRYHHAWLDGDMQPLRDVCRLVEQQDSASFRRMFAHDFDRRQRSPPRECRTTYCCGNEACCLHRWAKRMNWNGDYPIHYPEDRRRGQEFERHGSGSKLPHDVPDFPAPPRSPMSSFISDGSFASTSSTSSSSWSTCKRGLFLHTENQRHDDNSDSTNNTNNQSRQTSTTTTRTTASTTAIRNRRCSSTPPPSPHGSPTGRFAVDCRSEAGGGGGHGAMPGRAEKERERKSGRERERQREREREQERKKKQKKKGRKDVDVDEVMGAFRCIMF